MRGKRIVRTLMLTPWIVPSFVVAVLWQFMFQSDVGIVNKVLVDYTHILGDRPIWLLGRQHDVGDHHPVASGAGCRSRCCSSSPACRRSRVSCTRRRRSTAPAPFRRFRYITLPLLRPLIAVQLLFGVIYAAYQFSIPYVMFGSNPGPDADLMMTLIFRQSFSNNLFGFGARRLDAADARHVRLGADLVPRVQARPGGAHDRPDAHPARAQGSSTAVSTSLT